MPAGERALSQRASAQPRGDRAQPRGQPRELHLALPRALRDPAADGRAVHPSGGLAGPDGLALDEDGNLAIAHAQHGTVWLFSKFGEPLLRIRSCAGRAITNLAYGGPGNRTLYITEAETGSILAADMPVAGKRMFSHM
jgi:sugar lactone lactonase YvrE